MQYTKKFQSILDKVSSMKTSECQEIKKELLELSVLYKKKSDRLDKTMHHLDKQQLAILQLNEELNEYRTNLEKKVEEEIQKREAQEAILLEQSRLASIAAIIDAVAHQWRQPLNILSMRVELLHLEARKNDGVSQESVTKFRKHFLTQIRHLNDTLQNFRQFFRPIKEKQTFSVQQALQSVLNLIQDELIKHTIEITINEEDFEIAGNENEFKHIFLNLFSNAKDAFIANEITNRKITVHISTADKSLCVTDNAGGIDPNLLESIFSMHVTSKGDQGTGIGLYMSAQIAAKHHGKLTAYNTQDGAAFTFTLLEDPHND